MILCCSLTLGQRKDRMADDVGAGSTPVSVAKDIRPIPPPDRDEWYPGIFGLRFSKWLEKRKKG